jgi:hypothetical protein
VPPGRRGDRLCRRHTQTLRVRPEPELPHTYIDDRTAPAWLRMLEQSTDPGAIPVLLNANRDWLAANTPGDKDDDDTDLEQSWTRALCRQRALWAPRYERPVRALSASSSSFHWTGSKEFSARGLFRMIQRSSSC